MPRCARVDGTIRDQDRGKQRERHDLELDHDTDRVKISERQEELNERCRIDQRGEGERTESEQNGAANLRRRDVAQRPGHEHETLAAGRRRGDGRH